MRHAASVVLLLLCASSGRAGETPTAPPPGRDFSKLLNLEFCEEPLKECCQYLSGMGTTKLRCSEDLAGKKITLRVNQMPAASVFRHLARLTGTRALVEKDGTVLLTGVKSDLPEVPSLDRPPEVRKLTAEEEKRLPEMIRQLGADDFNARQAASDAIRSIGPSAGPALRATLADKDPERAQRAQALINEFDKLDWRKSAMPRLKKKVSFEFVQAPFTEAVNFVQSVADLNTVVDPAVLANGEKPVTLKMTQSDLEAALDWIARLGDCRWELSDHAVLFTKGAAALKPVKPSEAVRQALAKKVTLDLKEAPIEECINYVRGLTQINIVTDPKAFGTRAADPRTPITLKLEKASLEEVLGKIIAPVKLRIVHCKGDVIFITNPEKKPGN